MLVSLKGQRVKTSTRTRRKQDPKVATFFGRLNNRGGVKGEGSSSLLSSANKPPLVKQMSMKLMKMSCVTKNR